MTGRLSETPPRQGCSQIVAAMALFLPLAWWFLAPLVLTHTARQHMLGAAIDMALILSGLLAFGVAWRCRSGEFSNRLLPIACAMLVCSVAGMLEMTAHFNTLPDGANVIRSSMSNTSPHVSLLLAALFLTTAAFPRFVLAAPRSQYAALVVTVLLCGWLYWFAEDGGGRVTTEVAAANWGTLAILLLSSVLFWQQIQNQDRQNLSGLFLAAFALLLGELSRQAGKEINSVFMMLAQVYKVIAYYFVCRTIFNAAFLAPQTRLSELILAQQQLTQAVEACRAAEASECLLDSICSRINDGFVALDNNWRYTYVNASAARMLQRSSPADLIGKHIWSEFPENVDQPFQKACLSAHDSQQVVCFEQHILPWDLWFENRIYPSSDGVTIYFVEVTARKRAELAMAKQVNRLQQAETHARLGCWEFDVESAQFWWSAQTYAMLGINPAVEVPRFPDYLSGLHPDDLPVVIAAMGAMESGVVPAPLLFRSAPEIGPMRWFTTTVRQIESLEGKIKFAGTLLDVTAIKSAELAMRASESRLRTLIQTIPDCVSLKDTHGTYLLCNATMQRALGLKEADIVGKTDFDFLSRQEAEEICRSDRLALESSQPIRNEYWVTFADSGRQVLLETIKTPVRSSDGLVVGVLAIARDITALREAQENLTLLNRDLEQRVAERTEQLHALNQSLESFVYSVSHDLKAPLRGVEGYSKLLQEDCSERLGSEGILFLNNIRGGVARMNELIDDLLDYSRIDRRTMESSPIALLPLVEQVIAEQLPDREVRDAMLSVAIPPIAFLADRNGLKLALRNLLENAIKFSSHNAAPHIGIKATEGESSITMSISDNGIGFDLKYHDRIFEIFQRLHRIEDYPGTGVGLALVKKAVQRMGGRVWAQSEPGAGAVFFIELPKPG